MFISCTDRTTTCNIKAFDFFQHAKSAGWEFSCGVAPMVLPDGSALFIPKPSGEFVCYGHFGYALWPTDRRVMLFISKPDGSNPTNLLHNGWWISDFEINIPQFENIDSVDVNYGRQLIILVRDFPNILIGIYELQVVSIDINKNNGDCSIWMNEAFNPVGS